jgi:hypothetical protein
MEWNSDFVEEARAMQRIKRIPFVPTYNIGARGANLARGISSTLATRTSRRKHNK